MGLGSKVDIATTAAHAAVKMLAVSRALPTGLCRLEMEMNITRIIKAKKAVP
jgi:hypothetical protein